MRSCPGTNRIVVLISGFSLAIPPSAVTSWTANLEGAPTIVGDDVRGGTGTVGERDDTDSVGAVGANDGAGIVGTVGESDGADVVGTVGESKGEDVVKDVDGAPEVAKKLGADVLDVVGV